MTKPVFTNPETLALHGGSHRADPTTGSVAVPIHQTTSFQFQDTGHAARLFGLAELGNIYTRLMTPTTDVLETRIAAMEGGVAALAVASGQSATSFAVMNLCEAGDNIVSSTDLYGGTWNLFANTFKAFGIEVRDKASLPENAYEGFDGVVVDRVDNDGVAAEAGIGPGVLIRKVGKTPVKTIADFAAAIEKESPVEGVVLQVRTPRGNSVILLKKGL